MRLSQRRYVAAAAASIVALLLGAAAPGSAAPGDSRSGDSNSTDRFAATALTPTERISGDKSVSGQLAKSSPQLLKRTDSRPVRVMIKLDYDALASYRGGVDKLAATSPSVTGKKLNGTSKAEKNYRAYQARADRSFKNRLAASVPSAKVTRSYHLVYGGVAAVIPAKSAKRIAAMDGVAAVQLDKMNKPLTDASPEFLDAPAVYDELGTTENAGEGLIYANLDTGVWPEHPSFADLGNLSAPPGPDRECNFGDNPLTDANDPFQCQNKLIGGAHFTDTYDSAVGDDPYAGTARDSEGHGTHTASTTAGNIVDDVEVYGVDRGPIHGMAPGAWIMEYKVCGPQGCFGSDTTAAVGQAILDGADVINYSISGGTDPFSDPTEMAFLDAYAYGVFVSASAGNEGPGAGTANHLSPWVMTVGASTQQRAFQTTLTLTAGNGDTATFDGASITQGVGEFPVVMSADAPYSDPLCLNPAPAGTFEGMIVACQRGTNARVDKGYNVAQGGAEGMILFNPSLADVETDNHWLPTVHLPDGTDFVAFMDGHSDVTGSFPDAEKRDGQGDVMAAFSSRGPAGLFVKPDVTAPGVEILAGMTPTPGTITGGPPGLYYQAIAGTSMSSPHVAGAGLLVRAVHPDWTPGQIKSALMTTALTDVVKEDLTTPADPFDMGAGRITMGAAASAPLTLDETARNFLLKSNDPLQAVDLNIPSINATVMPGRLRTTRTFTNTTRQRQMYTISTDAPRGSKINVRPKQLNLARGQSKTVTITIRSNAPIGEQQFGSINLTSRIVDRGTDMHLPVAFIHTQGDVNLSQSCTPDRIRKGDQTWCDVVATNNSFDEQTVDLTTTTNRRLSIEDVDGAIKIDDHTAELRDVTLSGAAPGVPSVAPGTTPAGFIPLSAFEITPTPMGDEDIVNFNVPGFEFNGQTWTQIGVDSNGYVIAGGGTAEDNNCCSIPDGPDPAPPNNMMAPFWTDLDGTDTPGIYVALLNDGVSQWLVVEWEHRIWGTSDVVPMQAWIGTNGEQDVSYAYDPTDMPSDPGQPMLVGAENLLGQGDMTADVPTADLRVTSTDAVPGDSVTYTVVATGTETGRGNVNTKMEASGIRGTTIVKSKVRVRKAG